MTQTQAIAIAEEIADTAQAERAEETAISETLLELEAKDVD